MDLTTTLLEFPETVLPKRNNNLLLFGLPNCCNHNKKCQKCLDLLQRQGL